MSKQQTAQISPEQLMEALKAQMQNPEFKKSISEMLGVRQPRE